MKCFLSSQLWLTSKRVFKGVTLTGTYTLQDGIVTLRTEFGNKTAQSLGSDPATLASIMLRALHEDERCPDCGTLLILVGRVHLCQPRRAVTKLPVTKSGGGRPNR